MKRAAMKRTIATFAAVLMLGGAAGATMAQSNTGGWRTEFRERPADWGGDIHYAHLDMPNGQSLQFGCVNNRIERVLIVFPTDNGIPAPIAPAPQVRYSIDGAPLQPANWPVFERGSIEIPRGAESARMTRELMAANRFEVQAQQTDGRVAVAYFDLSGAQQVIGPMLASCNVR